MLGLDEKDWIILIIGTLLSVPAGIFATLLLGPVMTIVCGFHVIKALAKIRQCFFGDDFFDGEWIQNWHVESESFASENPSSLIVYRFLHLLAAEATQQPKGGQPYSFRMVAVLDAARITGKWMDPSVGGYYGAFQLVIQPDRLGAAGKWVGFSRKGGVKTGDWTWTPQGSKQVQAAAVSASEPASANSQAALDLP